MSSMHRFLRLLPWNEGPKKDNIDEFISSIPTGAMQRYQYTPAVNMIQRWRNHVEGWLAAMDRTNSNSLIAVRYEDLNERFEDTTEQNLEFSSLAIACSSSQASRG